MSRLQLSSFSLVFLFVLPVFAQAQESALWLPSPAKQETCSLAKVWQATTYLCVDVDADAVQVLLGKDGGTSFRISLPDGSRRDFVTERIKSGSRFSSVSARALEGGPETATLVWDGSKLLGVVNLITGTYRLTPSADGEYALYEVSTGQEFEADDFRIAPDAGASDGRVKSRDAGTVATVDVLVAYTSDVGQILADQGTTADAHFFLWSVWMQSALANGLNPDIQINLVGTQEVSYTPASDMGIDLDRLREPADGFMDDLHTTRALQGADLVALITDETNGACGIAWVNGPGSTGDYAFSVTALQCGEDTFAHELGHNIGMHHDPYVAPYLEPFEHGHGYVDVQNGFRTIMAYPSECYDVIGQDCTRLQHYSDPNIVFEGAPTGTLPQAGVPTSDNIRVAEEMAPLAESWTASVGAGTYGIVGQIVVDGLVGAAGVSVELTGAASASTAADDAGSFAFPGLADGTYVVTPVSGSMTFSPASRSIDVAGGNVLGQDFDATFSTADFVLTGYDVETNRDGQDDGVLEVISPGEYPSIRLTFRNDSGATVVNPHAVPIAEVDLYVHPYPRYYFDTFLPSCRDFAPDEEGTFCDRIDVLIDGDTPDGHEAVIPVAIYDDAGGLIGLETLRLPIVGVDAAPPFVWASNTYAQPGFIPVGSSGTLSAFVIDGSEVSTVTARVYGPSGGEVDQVVLTDSDGNGWFEGDFSPSIVGEHVFDVDATDDKGNSRSNDTNRPFTTQAFEQLNSTVVVDQYWLPYEEHSNPVVEAVANNGGSSDIYRIDYYGLPEVALLDGYDQVIWTTGSGGLSHYIYSYDRVADYLDGGGSLMLMGATIVAYSPTFFRQDYLQADYVQWSTGLYGYRGVAGTALDGYSATLHSYRSTNEMDPFGDAQPILVFDSDVTSPVSSAPQSEPAFDLRQGEGHPGAPDRVQPKGDTQDGSESPATARDVISSGTAGIVVDNGVFNLTVTSFSLDMLTSQEMANDLMGSLQGSARSISGTILVDGVTPANGVEVSLSGSSSDVVYTNEQGAYRFRGLLDGTYLVTPSSANLSFSPDSKSVVLAGSSAADQDFAATLTGLPVVFVGVDDFGFAERARAGRSLYARLKFANLGANTISQPYAVPEDSDPFIHPYDAYFFDRYSPAYADMAPGETVSFGDRIDFVIDGDAPVGYEAVIPMSIFDSNDVLVGDTEFRFVVSGDDIDVATVSPWSVSASPGYVPVGSSTTIGAHVFDGSELTAEAVILRAGDLSEVARISLEDPDGDRWFSNDYSPTEDGDFVIDIWVEDDKGNSALRETRRPFTTIPFQSTSSTLVVQQNWDPYFDFGQPIVDALSANSIEADLWKVDLYGAPSMATLLTYDLVAWSAGNGTLWGEEDYHPLIAGYLDAGGSLLLSGAAIADGAAYWSNEYGAWNREYLHSEYVQWSPNLFGVLGVTGQSTEGAAYTLNGWAWPNNEVDPLPEASALFTFDPSATSPTDDVALELDLEARDAIPGFYDPDGRREGPSQPTRDDSPAEDIISSGTAGLFVTGRHNLVYLSFAPATVTLASDREDLMSRVVGLFPEGSRISGTIAFSGASPASGITVDLSDGTTTTTGTEGTFGFSGLPDGTYTVTPSGDNYAFDPASREVTLAGENVAGQDFTASLASNLVEIESMEWRFDSYNGNYDEFANPGEAKYYGVTFRNLTSEVVTGPYAVLDPSYDPFVHPYDSYYFSEILQSCGANLDPESSLEFCTYFSLVIDGDAPDGHELTIPVQIFDADDTLLGLDEIVIPVTGQDVFPPYVSPWNVHIEPGYVVEGNPVNISAWIFDGSEVTSVVAHILRESDGVELAQVALSEIDNRQFGGSYTPTETGDFIVNVFAEDDKGNSELVDTRRPFTTVPFEQTATVLYVEQWWSPWDDYAASGVAALGANGVAADVWSIDERGLPSQTVLSGFDLVIWDTFYSSLRRDSDSRGTVAGYLNAGGKLLLMGSRISSDSESSWQSQYLGSTFVGYPRRFGFLGAEGDPSFGGMSVTMRRWDSLNEVDPSGDGIPVAFFDPDVLEPVSSDQSPAERDRLERRDPNLETLKIQTAPSIARDIISSGTAAIRVDNGTHDLLFSTFTPHFLTDDGMRADFMGRALSSLEFFGPPPPSGFTVTIDVSDAANSTQVKLGTRDTATDGYDENLDVFAPPKPPSGSLDARLTSAGDDYQEDYRDSVADGHQWNLSYQAGSGDITVSWDPSSLPQEGTFTLTDALGGVLLAGLDMRTESSYSPISALTQLQVHYSLDATLDVAVAGGWNMLSIPFDGVHNVDDTFPGAMPGTLFKFDGSYVSPSGGDMVAGDGYWLRFAEAATYAISGSPLSSLGIQLNSGWNMIGGPFCGMPLAEVDDPDGVIIPNTLYSFAGAYVPSDEFLPGRGYWLRADASGAIVLTCSVSKNREPAPDVLASLNKVSLLSGDRVQHLYLGNAQAEHPKSYSVPPIAPGQAWQAAFEDGRFVSEAGGRISILGAELPLRVTGDGVTAIVRDLSGHPIFSQALSAGSPLFISEATAGSIELTTEELPSEFSLEPAYPNPFNPQTTFGFSLPVDSEISLSVYDILGRQVSSLYDAETLSAGRHQVVFDASSLASGVYIIRLSAEGRSMVRQLVLQK